MATSFLPFLWCLGNFGSVSRTLIFQFTQQGTLSSSLSNAIAIIFAFFLQMTYRLNQERQVWLCALLSLWEPAY